MIVRRALCCALCAALCAACGATEPRDGAAAQPAPGGKADGAETGFSFAVFGDPQFYLSKCQEGAKGFKNAAPGLPQAILDLAPDLVLVTGDLMALGAAAGAYEGFERCQRTLIDRFPLFPTPGNHDLVGTGGPSYKAYQDRQLLQTNRARLGEEAWRALALDYPDPTEYSADRASPADEPQLPSGFTFKTYYAFRYRNVLFIAMEVGQHNWLSTPLPWLEAQLQGARATAAPAVDHIVVFMHSPMYSSSMGDWGDPGGYVTAPVREAYEALFKKYDVTLVLAGHAHLYDRFHVPDDPAACAAEQTPLACARRGCLWSETIDACSGRTRAVLRAPTRYTLSPDAIHYIVTGGGGGGNLSDACTNPRRRNTSFDFFQKRRCARNFLFLRVDGPTITVRAIELWGYATDPYNAATIEEFVIAPPPTPEG